MPEALVFHDQVIGILPKLRVQALALTRNRAAAEDLVQDAVCNALSAQDSFIPGTNFAAWATCRRARSKASARIGSR